MSFELLFWGLMIFWLLFMFMWHTSGWVWGMWGNSLLLWVLLALLGWKVYGPMLHG